MISRSKKGGVPEQIATKLRNAIMLGDSVRSRQATTPVRTRDRLVTISRATRTFETTNWTAT